MRSKSTEERALAVLMGRRLRDLRTAAGVTQMELAARVNRSWQAVQKYEDGSVAMSAPMAHLLAYELNTPVSNLLEVSEDG